MSQTFRRLSVLGTLLLAACTPQGPFLSSNSLANCYTNVPTKDEAAAWNTASRANTAKAYRSFVNKYPKSCYAPVATARLTGNVERVPANVRDLQGGESRGGGGGRGGY